MAIAGAAVAAAAVFKAAKRDLREETRLALKRFLDEDSLDVAAVSELLGESRSAILRRLQNRELYGGRRGTRWRIPKFQFVDDKVPPGLASVLRQLNPALHPLGVRNWLTLPEVDLTLDDTVMSPMEWLAAGRDQVEVADIARWVGVAP